MAAEMVEKIQNVNTHSDAFLPVTENEGIRDHLVETAVKFLTSPKILSYDDERKISFLEKKGLSKEEIEVSLSRAQKLIPNQSLYNSNVQMTPQYQVGMLPTLQPPAIPPRRSYWTFLRESANIFIFLSGIAYGVHYLYKHYIGPYLTGQKPKSNEDTLLEVQHSVMSVLQQIQNTLEKMDQNIAGHNKILKDITRSENLIKGMKSESIDDIQKQLNNIKGLLINKKAFPATPQVAPAIPHWQRFAQNHEETTSDKENGEMLPTNDQDGKETYALRTNDDVNSLKLDLTNGSLSESKIEAISIEDNDDVMSQESSVTPVDESL